MKRKIAPLSGKKFDVLVVGGGIHGAAAAWAAARRGLSTALIDRGDFGHATSANSLKIIHGGLRYLQRADLRRMRASILARRDLQILAPGSVRPLAFVIPTSGLTTRGRFAMRAALALNDLAGRDRNRGVSPEGRVPPGRIVSKEEVLAVAPGLPPEGITGGALWYDCIAEDTERLTLAFILAAAENGARVANYVAASRLACSNGTVTGAEATDVLTGRLFAIDAAVTVDATGPWTGELSGDRGGVDLIRPPRRWARASNIFVGRKLVKECALGVRDHESGQVFFLVPWRGGTMVGTWYIEHRGTPRCEPESGDLMRMVDDVNRFYPAAGITAEDVLFSHAGLVPLVPDDTGVPLHRQLETDARIVDFSRAGTAGLIGMWGVKYTTACRLGEAAAAMAARKLGRGGGAPSPAPLPGAAPSAPPVGPAGKGLASRVRHGVREEMALSLSDMLFRRTGLASAGHPGKAVLEECASLMAEELGWDTDRIRKEIAGVEKRLRPYEKAAARERKVQ